MIQVGDAPELTVSAPTEGQLYRAGDTITYNAFARDAAGFDLDDGDIKTEVRLHHGTHFHPFVGPLTGRAGSFTIPTTGEASADTSYEIKVTATDENGLSTTQGRQRLPAEVARSAWPRRRPGLGSTSTACRSARRTRSRASRASSASSTRRATAVAADGTSCSSPAGRTASASAT